MKKFVSYFIFPMTLMCYLPPRIIQYVVFFSLQSGYENDFEAERTLF